MNTQHHSSVVSGFPTRHIVVDTNGIYQRNNHHKIIKCGNTRKPIGTILCGKNHQDDSPDGMVAQYKKC